MKHGIQLLISPLRLHPRSGGGEYTKRVLTNISTSDEYIYIIQPKGYKLEIPSVYTHEFLAFRGVGILFLGLNIDYLYKLSKAIRQIKHNGRVEVILNGVFGAISTYIISKILNAKSIYIAHNIEIERYYTRSVFNNETEVLPILKLFIPLLEYFATKFDKIIVISYDDKRKLSILYNTHPERITVIPPKISKHSFVQKEHKNNRRINRRVTAVFHGTYRYIPNKEAMNLIRQYISKKVKYAQFVVFGSNAPKFTESNFKSLGFVDNLYEFLSSCDIAIVPLKRGAGVKLKILDYMVVGLPIVTTKKGAEGLYLINGKHAIIVDDVDEKFIEAVEYLIENPKMRKKLGHNAKKLVQKRYVLGIRK